MAHRLYRCRPCTSPSALGGITMMLAFILPVTAFFCWIVASLNYSFGFEIQGTA